MKKYKHKKIGESGYRAKHYLSKNGTLSTEHLYREWKFANGMREEVGRSDAPNLKTIQFMCDDEHAPLRLNYTFTKLSSLENFFEKNNYL